MESESALRTLLNELADFVTVTRAGFDEREQEQLSASLFPIAIDGWGCHILLAAQRNQRIDGGGAPSGKVASQQRNGAEQ